MSYYWWRRVNMAIKIAYFSCPTCLKYNPWKPGCPAPREFKQPNKQFESWVMDFIQIFPSSGLI